MGKRQTVGMGCHSTIDTYADSHLADTATTAGAAADKAASNKEAKYRQLANSHIFVPVAIERAGTWNNRAVELVQELGRRMTAVTDDSRETTYLFQRLSVCSPTGKCGLLPQHFHHRVNAVVVFLA